MAFPAIMFVAFFAITFVLVTRHLRRMKAQRELPTRDTFIDAQGGRGACPKCGAAERAEHGLHDKDDHRRIVACAQCSRLLYQYEREAR